MEKYIGLSSCEAEKSRIMYGENIIPENEKMSFWTKYWMNFNNPIITILLVSLGINLFFTFLGKVDWFECVGIFASVIISTFVSTLSEYKNENTFQKLQNEASKIKCKVYRDNNLNEILIDDIVLNDVVMLQSGDIIPADGVIISGSIKVDQSSLNGETKEIEKNDIIDESASGLWNNNRVFRGSVVCEGQALMKVSDIGENSLYGKLSVETQINENESPLNIKLSKLAKDISKFGYIGAVLVFVMFLFYKTVVMNDFNPNLIKDYIFNFPQFFSDFVEAIIMCVTILVVAVPDGLPLMIAIVCSLNMRKMLKDSVLVRKIVGIETAGGINILFTDKTGTLTKGKLSVTHFIDGNTSLYDSIKHLPDRLKKFMLISIIYNSSASINGKKIIGGNATEKALATQIMSVNSFQFNLTKYDETPFSSNNKFSQCFVRGEENLRLIKGAPEVILPKCKTFLDRDGETKPILKHLIQNKINEFANKSERIVVFAYSEASNPGDLIFLTAVSIKDEIRRNVKESVNEVKRAGINVIMMTGDKKETAVSIAKECNIIDSPQNLILTSEELNKMSDKEVKKILPDLRVISRAIPSDKSRLVRIAQELELVTGMTGDGVNDAPALKSADVGFAMGSGSDIAKESGDIVILDDDFNSIKKAVLYGRTIYKSIKKFITFQLTINIAAVSISVFSFLLGVIKPLSITQMLWVNLLMDTLAAIAFGGEAAFKKYLMEKPVKRNAPILDRKMWNAILINGGFISLVSIFFFVSKNIYSVFEINSFHTGYFNFFVFASVFNAFNTRADGIDLLENLALNKRFIIVMGVISIIQVIMTYFGGEVLRTNGLNFKEWMVVFVLSILIIPIDILRKMAIK